MAVFKAWTARKCDILIDQSSRRTTKISLESLNQPRIKGFLKPVLKPSSIKHHFNLYKVSIVFILVV